VIGIHRVSKGIQLGPDHAKILRGLRFVPLCAREHPRLGSGEAQRGRKEQECATRHQAATRTREDAREGRCTPAHWSKLSISPAPGSACSQLGSGRLKRIQFDYRIEVTGYHTVLVFGTKFPARFDTPTALTPLGGTLSTTYFAWLGSTVITCTQL
jgi:hypothetical protein